jgi:hypothetical protein
MGRLKHDNFEMTKLQLDISQFAHECQSLLRTLQHTGITFAKQNTTVQKDRFDTNTTIVNDYGRITATCALDPDGVNIALYAQKQIDGANPGDKPTGSIILFDTEGNETSRWNIERWHIESYTISGFNTKSSANMFQTVTLDMEKFTRA